MIPQNEDDPPFVIATLFYAECESTESLNDALMREKENCLSATPSPLGSGNTEEAEEEEEEEGSSDEEEEEEDNMKRPELPRKGKRGKVGGSRERSVIECGTFHPFSADIS